MARKYIGRSQIRREDLLSLNSAYFFFPFRRQNPCDLGVIEGSTLTFPVQPPPRPLGPTTHYTRDLLLRLISSPKRSHSFGRPLLTKGVGIVTSESAVDPAHGLNRTSRPTY